MTIYRIIRTIGKGSFGQVFTVKPTTSNKTYAMKRISTYNMNTKDKRNLLNEIRILKYSDCPYILKLIEVVSNFNNIEVITHLASYGDFLRIITLRKRMRFEEQLIWSYFIQVCLGLKYLHNNNIIHRDIKCANIFLDRGDKVFIGDFGSCKIIRHEQRLDCTSNVGTPYYMCPQVVSRQEYSTDADIWGLGCFLFEIITFQPPFKAQTYYSLKKKIQSQEFSTSLNYYKPYYSKELLKLVNKILKKENRLDIQHILYLPEVDEKKYLIPYNINKSQNIRSFEDKFRDLVYYNWYDISRQINK